MALRRDHHWRAGTWGVLLPGILAALAPKCPLCLAAYLSAFGVSVGAASLLAPLLRPVGVAMMLAAIGLCLIATWRRRERSCAGR